MSCHTGMCALKVFCVVFQILHSPIRSGACEVMGGFTADGCTIRGINAIMIRRFL